MTVAAAPALALALVIAAVAPRVRALLQGGRFMSLDVDTSGIPLEAIRFVEENGLRERMYNDFEIGSYLAFQGFPRYRVFVDPRLPAYPAHFHHLLGRTDVSRGEWTAAMTGYGVDTALLAYAGLNRRVAWWDPAAWALVYRQKDARVFVRRLPRWRALIAAREIPATFSFTVENGAVTIPIERPPPGSPVVGCVWQQRLGDLFSDLGDGDAGHAARAEIAYRRALGAPAGCLGRADEERLAAWLGAVDLRVGRWRDALTLLDRALGAGDGRDVATLTNRALALEGLGHLDAASAAWLRVAEVAGDSPLGARARSRARR